MAAYGSISGDIGPSDYWIVDYRIDHQIGSQKQRMPVKKKLNFAFLLKKVFKKIIKIYLWLGLRFLAFANGSDSF